MVPEEFGQGSDERARSSIRPESHVYLIKASKVGGRIGPSDHGLSQFREMLVTVGLSTPVAVPGGACRSFIDENNIQIAMITHFARSKSA